MAFRGFTYLPHHGFRCGFSGYFTFCQLCAEGIHDRSVLLAAGGGAALQRMAAKANMMLVNFIFRLKRDWGDVMGGKR